MSAKRWHSITFMILLYLIGLGMTGCSPETRYKVLTFFFTGVPKPGEEQESEKQAKKGKPGTKTQTARKRRELKFLKQAHFFKHGPFGAGQCERCHATAASKPFRSGKAKVTETVVAKATSIGPRLAFPWEELCVTCHSEKSAVQAKADGLWQHGPVANGWCTLCHSPHKSGRQYMLIKKTNFELCTQCHSVEDLNITMTHKSDPKADCISCHNPHVGKNSFLLKAEYDEWQNFTGL